MIERRFTLIRPAKQWTSMPSGTIPLFNWSLTNSSWLFSALMRNIPSACNTQDNIYLIRTKVPNSSESLEILKDTPEDHPVRTVVFASSKELWEYCFLQDHRNTALILLKLRRRLHCISSFSELMNRNCQSKQAIKVTFYAVQKTYQRSKKDMVT